MTLRLLLPIASLTALLSLSGVAFADVPAPVSMCDADGRGCTECSRQIGSSPESQKAFEACRDAAKAKRLVEACHEPQGTEETVFFCPEGVKVERQFMRGGGCAGCTIDAAATPGTIAVLTAALGVLALRRRRARR